MQLPWSRRDLGALERTRIAEAPWWVVSADDKKKSRQNDLARLLEQTPHAEVQREPVALPRRVRNEHVVYPPVSLKQMWLRHFA